MASTTRDLTESTLYRHWAKDKLRYCDTDRQGHVSNIAFTMFCETGRVEFLLMPGASLAPAGSHFVIARLTLDFRGEMHWPGEVRIGTAVLALGNSSFTLGQGIFVEDRCVATAESVIVLADTTTRRSTPLPEESRQRLSEYLPTA